MASPPSSTNPAAPAAEPASAPVPQVPQKSRLESVDLLRGLVMVAMALDHTRDFFHTGAIHGVDPLDLSTTTLPLFFTRWLTHFCAPVFVFLAGTGAFLSTTRGKSTGELSRFLFTRGLWLVFLELSWVQWLGWSFTMNLRVHAFLVIWAIGWSMIALSVLVHFRPAVILGLGLAMILGHNALDSIRPDAWGSWGPLWRVLHAGGDFRVGEVRFIAGYPLVPWIGVLAVGFCFGRVFLLEASLRRRWLWSLGGALTLAFVVLRWTNLYGDPKPWSEQPRPFFSFLSFLVCHKYPPSLCYLLMTLGPAVLVLAVLDRGTPLVLRPFLIFGRVPLFYYLLHLPLLHAAAVVVNRICYGRADWMYGLHPAPVPPEAGFGLGVTYLVWVLAILVLYPLCTWFGGIKRRRREVWLSYL
jgi:uncharacterized membrane protein